MTLPESRRLGIVWRFLGVGCLAVVAVLAIAIAACVSGPARQPMGLIYAYDGVSHGAPALSGQAGTLPSTGRMGSVRSTMGNRVSSASLVSRVGAEARAGYTFVVDRAGETSVSLTTESGATYEFDPHALQRLTERGISLEQAQGLLESGNSFQYFHDGAWKTGFYDPASKLFIGSANGAVITVIRGASQNYINNLLAARP